MPDKNKNFFVIIVAVIAVLALFFFFWNLTVNDLTSDDSLYAFRAVGWFDYLGGGQTTPVQWFGEIPAWAKLSFHDGPPLVFAILHLFFRLFGSSVLVARLPFALAGLAVVFLVYLMFKWSVGKKPALLAAFLASFVSYGVWAARAGYLEGMEVLFIVLSLLFFVGYIYRRRPYFIILWLMALGLALMAKYTAMFLIPAYGLYCLIWERKIFRQKEFWLGVIIFLLILSPMIIYNLKVFQTRGHLDAVWSSTFGIETDDFIGLSGRKVGTNYWGNWWEFFRTSAGLYSYPFFALWLLSLGFLIYRAIINKWSKLEKILLISFGFGFLLFTFIGVAPRFLSILVPLVVALTALAIYIVLMKIKNKKVLFYISLAVVSIVLVGEMFYSFNTNILTKPIGPAKIAYSSSRFYNRGFNQLDDYLRREVFGPLPQPVSPNSLEEISVGLNELKGQKVIFFDETIDWFPFVWYIQKYSFFYRQPLFSFYNYLQFASEDITAPLVQAEVDGFYYIYAADDSVVDSVKQDIPAMRDNMILFAQMLEDNNIEPVVISNFDGVTVFKIYYVPLSNN
ncbi:MAG TPA: glycosyltransferase family 39 protein [bacterium]|nr:glycosyltransferase family 39 protein [bacterium]